MPYNYFQQKAVYDQMNGTARKEQERAESIKKAEEKKRPVDANQLARMIVGEATGAETGQGGEQLPATRKKTPQKKGR